MTDTFTSKSTILPQITAQYDFSDVLSDVRTGTIPLEGFWLSCYRLGFPSVHGKVRTSLTRTRTLDGDIREMLDLEGRDGVSMKCKDGDGVSIADRFQETTQC